MGHNSPQFNESPFSSPSPIQSHWLVVSFCDSETMPELIQNVLVLSTTTMWQHKWKLRRKWILSLNNAQVQCNANTYTAGRVADKTEKGRSHRHNKIPLSFTRSFEVRGGKNVGSRARQTGFKPQAKEYELVGCAALKYGEMEGGCFGEPLPIP